MTVTDAQPLLGYRELYELWERQQWRVADLDFTQDRIDWHERFPRERRVAERFGLSGFFLGEQRVTRELGPMLRAAPGEEARLFLSTQIADVTRDEHRHVAFGVRFLRDAVEAGQGAAVRRAVDELEPHLDWVMLPPSAEGWDDDADLLGFTVGERRALARRELGRRLAVIGA